MSRFAALKEQWLEEGREHRGTWMPAKDSWYAKLYADYHTRKRLPLNRQGRCEYFHRVIWQILFVLRKPAEIALLVALLAALVWVSVAYTVNVLTLVAVLLVGIYFIAGMLVGADSRIVILKAQDNYLFPWIQSSPKVAIPVMGLLFLPGFVAMWVLIGLFYGLQYVVTRLSEVRWFGRAATWFAKGSLIPLRGFSWIRPWAAVLLVAWIVLNILVPEFIMLSIFIVCIVAGLAVIVALALLAETFKSKQKARKHNATSSVSEGASYVSLAKPKRPSWFARAWRNTVEFFAFIGAFIRTVKWKVCPVAEVTDDQ